MICVPSMWIILAAVLSNEHAIHIWGMPRVHTKLKEEERYLVVVRSHGCRKAQAVPELETFVHHMWVYARKSDQPQCTSSIAYFKSCI